MSHLYATILLQDDLLKQSCQEIRQLKHELDLAHAHIQFLEAKLHKLARRTAFDSNQPLALLRRQAE